MPRSGRSRSSRESRSSGHPRSWSARVRNPGRRTVGHPYHATGHRGARRRTLCPAGGGMRQVELHHGAATDVGLVREVNEDAFLAAPPVFVVADGMGGHDGGDVASAIVVEEFGRAGRAGLRPAPRRRGRRRHARRLPAPDRGVRRAAGQQRREHQWYAGTTVVVALLVEDDDGPAVAAGEPRRLPDLPVRRRRARAGERRPQPRPGAGGGRRRSPSADVATHPERNVITRALGGPDGGRGRLLPAAAAVRRAAGAVLRRRQRDDRRRRDRDDPARDRRPARRRRPGGRGRRRRGGRDNATAVVVDVVGLVAGERTTTLRARWRVSNRSWGPCRERRATIARSYRAGELVRHLRRARHRAPAALGEGAGRPRSGSWSTTAPGSTRSWTR